MTRANKHPAVKEQSKGFKAITIAGVTLALLLSACSNISKRHHKKPASTIAINTHQIIPITFGDSDWQERVFAGSTRYEVIQKDGAKILKASSKGTASILYKVVDIDLTQTPFIQWEWKVNHVYKHTNERSRKGDDFPARVYIAIASKSGSIFPRALTYVWSSNLRPLSNWKNPYSDAVVMLSLQNGAVNSRKWLSQKRNLREDLSKYFGENIEKIQGIAVMTDTDNTGASAVSFYRKLRFTAQ